MRTISTLGLLWIAAAVTFGGCSSTPNSAGDDGGPSIGTGDDGGGEGSVVGVADGGRSSSGSGSGSSGGAGSSSGSRRNSGSSSSGQGSTSSGGGMGDGGCPASCVRLQKCCPMLAQVDAGNLTAACTAAANTCNDMQCALLVNMSIGGQKCPP